MARPKAITSLKEAGHNEGKGSKNWLIYSDPGIGKTTLMGTAPKSLFLTVEAAGTESARALGSQSDELVVPTWKEFGEAYLWLEAEGHLEYDWVLPDSITELEEICWTGKLESSGREYVAQIQDYGIVDKKIKKMVDRFHRLPINVCWSAHMMGLEMEDEDGDDIIKRLPKIGRPKNGAPLSHLVCGKTTLNGLLIVVEDDDGDELRRLWVHGNEKFVAKDRHDTFNKYVDAPNIADMATAVDKRRSGTKKKKGK